MVLTVQPRKIARLTVLYSVRAIPKSARFRPPSTFSRVLSSFRGLTGRLPAGFSHQCRLDYYMNYYTDHRREGARLVGVSARFRPAGGSDCLANAMKTDNSSS